MKFEEAKKRRDYKFTCVELEHYIDQIRAGCLDGFCENDDGVRGAAVMEIGYVDIEINMYSAAQVINEASEDDMSPVINYFCCKKISEKEWHSDRYLDYTLQVDWKAEDWKEQLEKDMFTALDEYVRENNLSYDQPTWSRGKKSKMKNKKHFVELKTYIFGSTRTLIVETEYTADQIKNDWSLRTKLINQELVKESIPQDNEIEEWWSSSSN